MYTIKFPGLIFPHNEGTLSVLKSYRNAEADMRETVKKNMQAKAGDEIYESFGRKRKLTESEVKQMHKEAETIKAMLDSVGVAEAKGREDIRPNYFSSFIAKESGVLYETEISGSQFTLSLPAKRIYDKIFTALQHALKAQGVHPDSMFLTNMEKHNLFCEFYLPLVASLLTTAERNNDGEYAQTLLANFTKNLRAGGFFEATGMFGTKQDKISKFGIEFTRSGCETIVWQAGAFLSNKKILLDKSQNVLSELAERLASIECYIAALLQADKADFLPLSDMQWRTQILQQIEEGVRKKPATEAQQAAVRQFLKAEQLVLTAQEIKTLASILPSSGASQVAAKGARLYDLRQQTQACIQVVSCIQQLATGDVYGLYATARVDSAQIEERFRMYCDNFSKHMQPLRECTGYLRLFAIKYNYYNNEVMDFFAPLSRLKEHAKGFAEDIRPEEDAFINSLLAPLESLQAATPKQHLLPVDNTSATTAPASAGGYHSVARSATAPSEQHLKKDGVRTAFV